MKRVIVLIDIQNDFVCGSLGSPEAEAILDAVIDLLHTWDGDMIVTMDTHGEDYLQTTEGKMLPVPHCIKGTTGWEHPASLGAILEKRAHHSIHKETFGSMELPQILLQAGYQDGNFEMSLVGLCTDICVISNAIILKTAFPNTKITVDASCCAGTSRANHDAALAVMRSCQIEIINDVK